MFNFWRLIAFRQHLTNSSYPIVHGFVLWCHTITFWSWPVESRVARSSLDQKLGIYTKTSRYKKASNPHGVYMYRPYGCWAAQQVHIGVNELAGRGRSDTLLSLAKTYNFRPPDVLYLVDYSIYNQLSNIKRSELPARTAYIYEKLWTSLLEEDLIPSCNNLAVALWITM